MIHIGLETRYLNLLSTVSAKVQTSRILDFHWKVFAAVQLIIVILTSGVFLNCLGGLVYFSVSYLSA